ncbi:MAG: protein kinase [Verrucomicrobiales bacterium]|nr:protein kinase [Verrucomicrobiales bacterium]
MGAAESLPDIPGYQLIEPIGSGSYGTVWVARSVTGGLRAVKILRRSLFKDAAPYDREFKGLTLFAEVSLREPRQLALLHVGRDDAAGVFYYVMELADDLSGGTGPYAAATVKALMEPSRRPSAREVVRLGSDMARAIASLHSNGCIHRDIKPENIILVRGVPKLADIGLVAEAGRTQTVLGTRGYTPEVGGGRPSADVYALGKVLYELAFGLHRDEFPRLPPDIDRNPDWPVLSELNAIILRACDETVAHRYPDGAAILKDLVLLEAGESILRVRNNERRLALARRTGAVLALLAVLGTALGAWQSGVATREREQRARIELAEKAARRALERSRLGLAEAEIGNRRFGRARQYLEEIRSAPPSTNGFEWHVLWNEAQGDPSLLLQSVGSRVKSLAVTPDERSIAGLTVDDHFARWNPVTGALEHRQSGINALGGYSAPLQGWIVGTTREEIVLIPLAPESPSTVLASHRHLQGVLPDGTLVALLDAGSESSLRWLAPDGRSLSAEVPLGGTPGGHLLFGASTADKRFGVVGRDLGGDPFTTYSVEIRPVESPEETVVRFVEEGVWSHDISPDGHWFAVGLFRQGDILTYELPGLVLRQTLHSGHNSMVGALAFSPDSRRLASGGADGTVRIWNVGSDHPAQVLSGHGSPVSALAWGSTSNLLVSADTGGEGRIWSLARTKSQPYAEGLAHRSLGRIAVSSDGLSIAATDANGDVLVMQNQLNRDSAIRLKDAFEPIAFLDGNRKLLAVSLDQTATTWDLADPLHPIRHGPLHDTESDVTESAASDDGQWLAAQGRNGVLSFLHLASGRRVRGTNESLCLALAAAPDTPYFLTGGPSGEIRIWDPTTGRAIWSMPGRSNNAPAIYDLTSVQRGSTILAGDASGALVVVQVTNRTTVVLPLLPSAIATVTASERASRVACGHRSGDVVLLDLDSREEKATFKLSQGPGQDPGGAASRLIFARSGDRLVGRSKGGAVRIWSAETTTK